MSAPSEVESPEPSSAAVSALLLMYAEAFIEAVPLDMSVAFVRALAEQAKRGEHESGVVTALGKLHPQLRADREALAMLRKALPHLVAKLGVNT